MPREKKPEAVPAPAAPSVVKIEGVEEAEQYQAENPSHKLVKVYRPDRMSAKIFEYVKE